MLRIIKELEDLTDIAEKESHKLAALCGVLFECEDQFDLAGPLVERAKGDAYNDEVCMGLFSDLSCIDVRPRDTLFHPAALS